MRGAAGPMPAWLAINRLAGLDVQGMELGIQKARVMPVVLVDPHKQGLAVFRGVGRQLIQIAKHRFFEKIAVRRPQPEIYIQTLRGSWRQLEQGPLKEVAQITQTLIPHTFESLKGFGPTDRPPFSLTPNNRQIIAK
ncbi:hypothetical protein D3C72_1618770 [compost metagenome]